MEDVLFSDLLARAAGWLLVGCAGWGGLICAAAVLEASTGGRLRATTWVACPASLRRLLLAGLGVALVAAPAPAALGAPAAPTQHGSQAGHPTGSPAGSLAGLPPPARPGGGLAPGPPHLVVRPGDTVWRLAADRLPRSASAGQVAAFAQRLHHRNLSVIGPDPDLIRPGQRLVVPPTLVHPSRPPTRPLEEMP